MEPSGISTRSGPRGSQVRNTVTAVVKLKRLKGVPALQTRGRCSTDGAERKRPEDVKTEKTCVSASVMEHVVPTDQVKGQVQKKEREDDDYFYCEHCRSFFTGQCNIHGPAVFVPDAPVPMGVTDRAVQTLPPGLEVEESSIPGAGLGVFNTGEIIPAGVQFGPYEGDLVDEEEAVNSNYSVVIYKYKPSEEFMDGRKETHANWMRYVNCAHRNDEKNLEAFHYQGKILFRSCRNIKPGQELLVWSEEGRGKGFDEMKNRMQVGAASQIYENTRLRRRQLGNHEELKKSREVKPSISTLFIEMSRGEVQRETRRRGIRAGEKPYHCPQCGRSFSRQCSLRNHLHTHTGKKTYPCQRCGESFGKWRGLRKHRCIHRGRKTYLCSQCGKSFSHAHNFRVHQRIHTGEKPYHCSQCGKCFAYRSTLRRHRRIHTGERPYHCSECGKCFSDRGTLRRHQRIHTGEKPYICFHCGNSFAAHGALRRHQRLHTGEKPHRCTECGESFTHYSTFQHHKRTRTLMPYQCSRCEKSFTVYNRLRVHQRLHAQKDHVAAQRPSEG